MKQYDELIFNILLFSCEDIITTSDEKDVVDDPYVSGGDGTNWWG